MTFEDIVEFFIDIVDLNYQEFIRTGSRPFQFSLVPDGNFIQASIVNKPHPTRIEYMIDTDSLTTSVSHDVLPPQFLKTKEKVVRYVPKLDIINVIDYKLEISFSKQYKKILETMLKTSTKRLKYYFLTSYPYFGNDIKGRNFNYYWEYPLRDMIYSINLCDKNLVEELKHKILKLKDTHNITLKYKNGLTETI